MLIKVQYLVNKYKLNIKGILHIGAHECEELNDYLDVGVSLADIIWIEANKNIYQKMIEQNPNVKIYCETISDTDGENKELIVTNNFQSSSILELDEHKKEHPNVWEIHRQNVLTKTIDTFYRENDLKPYKYNFVNIDIQGAELLAIKGMKNAIKHIDYFYLEVNTKHLYKYCPLINELEEYLKKYNFKRVELSMTPHGWGDAFYVKINE